MQNIKTGIVVALLLAVSYGAFKALNAPEPDLPPELDEWVSEEADLDSLLSVEIPGANSQPKFDSALSPLPNASAPSLSLPPAELAQLPKAESSNPNSNAFGDATAVQIPVSTSADGPSIKIPTATALNATLPTTPVADSLVPDSFPATPTRESTFAEGSTSASGNSGGGAIETPNPLNSIPLPGVIAPPIEPNSLTAVQTNTDVGALPLLPDSNPQAAPVSNSSQAAQAPQALEQFSIAREQALKQAGEGKLKEALASLTRYYNSPEISHDEYTDLLEILDALAREVIYSQRHLLRAAYTSTASDTLVSIAAQHNITPELLKSINQLGNAQVLAPGQQLKVVEGPFRGEVDLTRGEITLFLKDMYACRFPISVGADPAPKLGSFEVADKRTDRTYYGAGGKVINASDPSNPYGGHWIDLGQGNCLHGSAEMTATDLQKSGCISLSPIDANDAYIMLTQGSQVVIR